MGYESNNSKYTIIIGILIIAMVGVAIYLNYGDKLVGKKETPTTEEKYFVATRTLSYYNEGYIYVIKQEKDNFTVETNEQVMCVTAPCEPINVDSYRVRSNSDKNKLDSLLSEIFSITKENELSVTDKDLSPSQANALKAFLLNEGDNDQELTYTISEAKSDSSFTTEGYRISKLNGKVILTVGLGKKVKTTSIGVDKIDIENDTAKVYISELLLAKAATEEDNYPTIEVEFSKMPTYIYVINSDNNMNYENLDGKSEETKDLAYKITDRGQDSSLTRRGYLVESTRSKATVTIALGEKNTGGYSIELTKIRVNNSSATIYVKENKPAPGSMVTQAITYPILKIEFETNPGEITVVDEETGDNYSPYYISHNTIDYKTIKKKTEIKTKGYLEEETEEGYLVTIAMGEQTHLGYSIEIQEIRLINDEAVIYVKEIVPKDLTNKLEKIDYPSIQVLFTKKPNKLLIVDAETKASYPKINSES